MKEYKAYSIAAFFLALAVFTACDSYEESKREFDNAVYLDIAEMSQVQSAVFKKSIPTLERPFHVQMAYPASEDVTVTVSADPSLVETYNAIYKTAWKALDATYYDFPSQTLTVEAGRTLSETLTLNLKNLMGDQQQGIEELNIDETFVLPVTITQASMSVLNASSTAYYVVKRSSAITSAASLRDNWITLPKLDEWGPLAERYSNLNAITFEAFIYVYDFSKHNEISTIMGIEDYLLLRIGDSNFERQQLQFDGSGVGFGKFPKKDDLKLLNAGEWYHIAATYDEQTRIVRIYVNGKLQSEGTEMGLTTPELINLAKRGYYNLFEQNPDNEDYKKAYGGWGDARQLFFGKSYDDSRQLNGDIAEVRIWSVARTPEQIRENMYDIPDPENETSLLGYWKFDEGEGNIIYDRTGHGNDAVAAFDLEWPEGVEIPQINVE